jgi:hypothetical protein
MLAYCMPKAAVGGGVFASNQKARRKGYVRFARCGWPGLRLGKAAVIDDVRCNVGAADSPTFKVAY